MPEKNDVKKGIDSYIGTISNKFPIKQVILFGSYANGKQSKYSDIDLAIVSPKFTDKKHLENLKFLWIEAAKIDSRIEPIPFSTSDLRNADPRSFLGEILRTGKTIYKK